MALDPRRGGNQEKKGGRESKERGHYLLLLYEKKEGKKCRIILRKKGRTGRPLLSLSTSFLRQESEEKEKGIDLGRTSAEGKGEERAAHLIEFIFFL